MTKRIATILFDLGGVFVPNSDGAILEEMSRTLGIDDEEFQRRYAEQKGSITCGERTLYDFYVSLPTRGIGAEEALRKHIAVYAKHTDQPNNRMIELLPRLRRYKVAAFTNTEPEITAYNKHGLFRHFPAVITSVDIGFMKPSAASYRTALEKLAAEPASTLFIDDKKENVAGAEAAGLAAILFTEPMYRDTKLFEAALERAGVILERAP